MSRERINELFAQAIELPAHQRADWIAEQCRGDEAMRAKVEQLLRADAKARDFMEQAPASIADAAAAAARSAAPIAFGVYRVVRSIGQGGMGEVWLAERNDGEFDQRVAVKRLTYPTPGLLQRFRQERQILAAFEHPNIARLIDGGLDADGIPYLAMEYVEGVPITDYVGEHDLGVAARLRLFLRVCEAVQYAHQNLIVHRDLKPSNIFVTTDGTPKLLDFGIAKVLTTTETSAATQTVARLLTPDYAAPEQFTGGAITTATDVFALGVVLYELLAGARPWRSASSGEAAMMATLLTDPPPPSAAIDRAAGDAIARRRVLRGDLDRIVLTAIAKDPARRYPSADAFAADIRRYLEGRPVAARGDGAWYRFGKFARRNRYALAAAVLAITVCIAATAISLRQAQRANEQAARAQAARQFLVGVFEQANPDENRGRSMTAHELLQKGERQLTGRFIDEPAARADVTGLIGGLYWDLGDYERALALLKEADTLTEDPRVPDEIKARNLTTRASIEIYNKNSDEAVQHAQQALAYADRAGAIAKRERSDARREIAHAMMTMNGVVYADVVVRLQQLLADDRVPYGERSDVVAKDLGLLGLALQNAGRRAEAIDVDQHALEINRVLYGERSAPVSTNLFYLGLLTRETGDNAAAEIFLKKCVDIRSEIYGADHPETIDARNFLLLALEGQGRYAEVLPARLRLIEDQLRFRESNPSMVASAYNMLGDTYNMLGRPVEAERALRDSLTIWATKQGATEGVANRRLAQQPRHRAAAAGTFCRGRGDTTQGARDRARQLQCGIQSAESGARFPWQPAAAATSLPGSADRIARSGCGHRERPGPAQALRGEGVCRARGSRARRRRCRPRARRGDARARARTYSAAEGTVPARRSAVRDGPRRARPGARRGCRTVAAGGPRGVQPALPGRRSARARSQGRAGERADDARQDERSAGSAQRDRAAAEGFLVAVCERPDRASGAALTVQRSALSRTAARSALRQVARFSADPRMSL